MGKGLRVSINIADDTELRSEMRRLLGEEVKSITREAQAEMRRALDEEIAKTQKTIKLHLEVALQKVKWIDIVEQELRRQLLTAASTLVTPELHDRLVKAATERLAFGARDEIERKMRAEIRAVGASILASLSKTE